MKHLAKIELVGRVGIANERIVGNERLVRFSLGVDDVYHGGSGSVVKTTWFSCRYWGNAEINKGQEIHLEGKMSGETYTDADGKNRQCLEVRVSRIW